MSASVPQDLYDEVLRLAEAIAQPERGGEAADTSVASAAMIELRSLFERHQATGKPHPFLTETLADFTDDDVEAVRLYRLAVEQAASLGDEPTHSIRLGLAQRLHAIGDVVAAAEQLGLARQEAFRASDLGYMSQMDELASALRSNKSLERSRDG